MALSNDEWSEVKQLIERNCTAKEREPGDATPDMYKHLRENPTDHKRIREILAKAEEIDFNHRYNGEFLVTLKELINNKY